MLAAAALVIVAGSIVFARRAAPPDLRVRGAATGTPTPTPERAGGTADAGARTHFLGSGAWTMSSLPDCFSERERERGPLAALRAHFPPAPDRVAPGTVVRAGGCRIAVGAHELTIARGDDRLRVPPEARLYREHGSLTLVTIDGRQAEIRRY